jgi:chemotaxis protein methyltransferase CheR
MSKRALLQPARGEWTQPAFEAIAVALNETAGLVFPANRRESAESGMRRAMAAACISDPVELQRAIRAAGEVRDILITELTIGETFFLREQGQFDFLRNTVLPQLRLGATDRPVRMWSAGCATGEEPYSIAMTICDSIEFAEAWNINIMATDISRKALAVAEAGLYPRREVEAIGLKAETYFTRSGDQYVVRPKIRNMVSFAQMNLAQTVYMGRFDIIFCMNVMIYFSEERRGALIQRFYEYLEPGGYLFVGHAESVAKLPVKFDTTTHGDCILYQKPGVGAARKAAGD